MTHQHRDPDQIWRVVLYNDDAHSFEEVVVQVQYATSCTLLRSVELTYFAHTAGQATVFEGSFAECRCVVQKLREIGLDVTICG